MIYSIIVVNLLMCLIYKLNFIIGTNVQEKTANAWSVLPVVLGICWGSWNVPPRIRGDYCIAYSSDPGAKAPQKFKSWADDH